MTEQKRATNDVFARIAVQREERRESAITEQCPPDLTNIVLPLDALDTDSIFKPASRIDTPKKLKAELARQRRLHVKFLRNLAPESSKTREMLQLKHFDWRVQTDSDLADFISTIAGDGSWEQVTIPHYGAPLGRAVTYYRNNFDVNAEMLARGALFICFKGVDYKAHVFINGSYIGSHEGFFAPFEFDITGVIRNGKNTLLVKVENDAICMSNDSWGDDGALFEGDKIYAATGPGYDEPVVGWHHCPPGMGIYQNVYVEARSPIFISDIFIRPLLDESRAEAWIEVYNCQKLRQDIQLKLSVYGQNFRASVLRDRKYDLPGPVGPGVNYFRLPFDVPNSKVWDIESPWLYQAQLQILNVSGELLDVASRQFGMRSFNIDEECKPKGRFFLNGREIRLRGANTMGFEQQDVMKCDWNQLIDDILLAKICNMNFLRFTQRPVQAEVYDYCDRLGLMTQTDLPLFAVLRRNQFAEAIRQTGEMERLVRSHPCNIMVSYINEPFPNAWEKPHRHLTRPELESFFTAASEVVRLTNPDRMIKPVDGDYDPPAPGLPDNHCYNGWYNGHGLDIGKLQRGYWQHVKADWMYGCGEFGAEGLDPVETMHKHYPADWLPHTPEEEHDWTPNSIPQAQTGRFHYMWFDTQHSVANWVKASQTHQARIVRLMTEAFRRDNRLNSCAVHLFIDAFPSGWMKTIMDVDRNPKPAYFSYKEALSPLMACLRADRHAFFSGEKLEIEAWVCNDLLEAPNDMSLHYQLEMDGKVILARHANATVPVCSSEFQGKICISAPDVDARTQIKLRIGLIDRDGVVTYDSHIVFDVFPSPKPTNGIRACVIGNMEGSASRLCSELGLELISTDRIENASIVVIDDFEAYKRVEKTVLRCVKNGLTAVFLGLPAGTYSITRDRIKVNECGMGARHFVSRATEHRLVSGFKPDDFMFWYDDDKGYITPIISATISASGWNPILSSGNGDWAEGWSPAMAAVEKKHGKGIIRLCQIALAARVGTNPVADMFARRMMEMDS